MESLLFFACLIGICWISAWTVAKDRQADAPQRKFERTNAAQGEKVQRSSRFFRHRL